MEIFVWIIISYGLMNIVVFSSLFSKFREWVGRQSEFLGELITCPMCFSTWGGFFLSIVLYSPTHVLFLMNTNISWFFDGLLSTGAVWAINSLVEFLEENRIK